MGFHLFVLYTHDGGRVWPLCTTEWSGTEEVIPSQSATPEPMHPGAVTGLAAILPRPFEEPTTSSAFAVTLRGLGLTLSGAMLPLKHNGATSTG